jgi:hypothetical protein
MTASSTNIDKALTKHDMNASRFISRLVIDPESTTNDTSKIATMASLVPETLPHRRRHRRQNAQFFGFFEVDKETSTPTSVTAESLPVTNNPDPDSIVSCHPKTSPRQQRRQKASLLGFSEETTTPTCSTHCSGDDSMHPNKDTPSMALQDNNTSHLMQWRFAQRYLTNSPVSPHNKDRHTCSSFDSSSSNDEDGNDDNDLLSQQGVTQLSQLYANGRYKKERGEFITEDYFFRNDEGTWNHLEWHSRQ